MFVKKRVWVIGVVTFQLFSIPGVTYQFHNGRFGDNLQNYAKSKWYAHM